MKLQLLKGWFSLWQESEGEDQAAGGGWKVTCAAAAWFLCKNIANFAPVPRTSLKMSRSSNNPAPAHNSTTLRFPTLILNYSSKQIRFGKLWFSDYQYIHFSNSAPSLQNSFGSGFGLQDVDCRAAAVQWLLVAVITMPQPQFKVMHWSGFSPHWRLPAQTGQ